MPACSPSPIPAVAHRLTAPAALAPDQYRRLLEDLAHIADPRHRRGRRHTLGTVLAVAVAAVLAGAKSLAAIGEWAADAPGPVLAALGTRPEPLRRVWRPPAEATVRRVLARVDPDALDQVIGRWLSDQQRSPASPPPRPAPPASPTGSAATGASRRCTTSAMSPSPRTPARSAPAPPPGPWPAYFAIGILRARGHRTIAAALRRNARDATRLLPLLGVTSP